MGLHSVCVEPCCPRAWAQESPGVLLGVWEGFLEELGRGCGLGSCQSEGLSLAPAGTGRRRLRVNKLRTRGPRVGPHCPPKERLPGGPDWSPRDAAGAWGMSAAAGSGEGGCGEGGFPVQSHLKLALPQAARGAPRVWAEGPDQAAGQMCDGAADNGRLGRASGQEAAAASGPGLRTHVAQMCGQQA